MLKQLGALCTSGRFIEQASCAVAVVTDPANNWHEIDGARAVQSMELAGWNEGVGTCWIGSMNRDRIKELLDIPKPLHLLTILPSVIRSKPDAPRRRTKKTPCRGVSLGALRTALIPMPLSLALTQWPRGSLAGRGVGRRSCGSRRSQAV